MLYIETGVRLAAKFAGAGKTEEKPKASKIRNLDDFKFALEKKLADFDGAEILSVEEKEITWKGGGSIGSTATIFSAEIKGVSSIDAHKFGESLQDRMTGGRLISLSRDENHKPGQESTRSPELEEFLGGFKFEMP